MALIKCPNCGGQISDKAAACVHCGAPLLTNESQVESDNIITTEPLQSSVAHAPEVEKKKKSFQITRKTASIALAIVAKKTSTQV